MKDSALALLLLTWKFCQAMEDLQWYLWEMLHLLSVYYKFLAVMEN